MISGHSPAATPERKQPGLGAKSNMAAAAARNLQMGQLHPPGIVMQNLPSVENDPPSARKKIQGPAYDGFDLDGAEKAVRHEYDPRGRKWTRTAFLCRIEDTPFAEGTMRFAHR